MEILPSARKHGISDDDNDYVIHAMTARTKYVKMIKSKRGGQP